MKRLLLALGLLLGLASPSFAVDSATVMGNANYSALPTDVRIVIGAALTQTRTLTLPFAGATCIGQTCGSSALEVTDSQNNVGGSNSCLSVAPSSGDTINNSASTITFCSPLGRLLLFPLTGTNWYLQIIGPGALPATATNDNAQAGSLGEIITNNSLVTSAPSLANNTAANITSALLTPGDWDCRGSGGIFPANSSSSSTGFAVWISTVSATSPLATATGLATQPVAQMLFGASIVSTVATMETGPIRISLAATASAFLSVSAAVANSQTFSGVGNIQCRRAR